MLFRSTLRWHIERFNSEHSIDALPYWEIEVSYYNHEHQKLLIFQIQSMLMFYQKLISSQRQCQQENVFLQSSQQSNPVNNFPFYLTDFHSFFISLFENCLESFPSWKLVNSVTLTHNTNNFFSGL